MHVSPALFIPSPSNGVWHLGPLPIRGYALAIILGIVAAIWIGERRWQARGGEAGQVQDFAIWAVPFGLVGGRLYHVATDHELYFGPDGNPWAVFFVWRGGLGVWGSIALGAVGVLIAARLKGFRLWPVLDALAPGVLVAQALGRWGNWFNQELFGKPTDLPWALEIDAAHRPPGYEQFATFHPTFLYEFVWNLLVFAVLLRLDKRFRFGHGQMLALYVMGYTLGRGWIEMLRIDTVELNDVGGLRFNVWTSLVLFLVGLAWFLYSRRRWPEQEPSIYRPGRGPAARSGEGSGEAHGEEEAVGGSATTLDHEPGERPDHGSDARS
nr:prolipoprotein diacylglyceryl transferase [Nocardioides flavescens]